MSQPTIEEIDEHMVEERQKDKRYFPISGWRVPHKTLYFDFDKWKIERLEELNLPTKQ